MYGNAPILLPRLRDAIATVKNFMPKEILGEIAEWKLEAKLEDSERYFYFSPPELNIGMMTLALGNRAHGIGKRKCLFKIFE